MSSLLVQVAKHRSHLQGLLFVVTAAIIWVLASFVVQEVEDEGLSPLLLTYIANSLFIVYLPIDHLLKRSTCGSKAKRRPDNSEEVEPEARGLQQNGVARVTDQAAREQKLFGYFERDLLKAAAVVAPLWFLAQLTFNTSLHLTSVTSNTILSSTASLFTYGLSWAVVGEPFVAHKLVSILCCAAGTSIVTLADSSNSQRPSSVAGDALCLLSAVFYACYTVAIKKMLHTDTETNTMLFFGYMGLINLVCLAPLLLFLVIGAGGGALYLSAGMLALVIAKGLLDNVLSDYLWARAVLLVGPTVATVGMSVQVPLAVALDIVWKRPDYIHNTWVVGLMIVGGWYVLAGFVGVNVPPKCRTADLKSSSSLGSDEATMLQPAREVETPST